MAWKKGRADGLCQLSPPEERSSRVTSQQRLGSVIMTALVYGVVWPLVGVVIPRDDGDVSASLSRPRCYVVARWMACPAYHPAPAVAAPPTRGRIQIRRWNSTATLLPDGCTARWLISCSHIRAQMWYYYTLHEDARW